MQSPRSGVTRASAQSGLPAAETTAQTRGDGATGEGAQCWD